jgi:hypothetical protein
MGREGTRYKCVPKTGKGSEIMQDKGREVE